MRPTGWCGSPSPGFLTKNPEPGCAGVVADATVRVSTRTPPDQEHDMTTTDLTGALQKLHTHGYSFTLRSVPDASYKFTAADERGVGVNRRVQSLADITSIVNDVLDGREQVEPSTGTQSLQAALASIGAAARFFAINGAGDTVTFGDENQPAVFKQRAAAFRRGAEAGAVAVWDAATDKVESL